MNLIQLQSHTNNLIVISSTCQQVCISQGGGGLPYETDGDARRKILNLTPKGDPLGMAQAFCAP